ncbi:Nucleic-acid-binding protein from transposon X-element [Eumeta japonica]|uniref:Nucleic-acid-binding protein from transposon X-element n=1 Tax=Eumeta variegata TaxID=151549 RepID=A0A4C1Z5H2_EUMVA|nr:Nucleic-acid-binding protein from transposon X-element [Eumeta japonica]
MLRRSKGSTSTSSKVRYHTYAFEEERKHKIAIRGNPENIPTDDIKTDLTAQGYPVYDVYRIHRRDGSATVCGLSGIRVDAPHKRGGPGQCHLCQCYGHASANCYAQPRCVKSGPPLTRECPLTKESAEKLACVNCSQSHTANYKWCPKAPKVIVKRTNRTDRRQSGRVTPPPVRDSTQFLALEGKKGENSPEGRTRTASEVGHRSPPEPAPARSTLESVSGFAEGHENGDVGTAYSKELGDIRGYLQLRTDRTDAPLGGTAIYYKRSLHCWPINSPFLTNTEATGCRLAMTGPGTLF